MRLLSSEQFTALLAGMDRAHATSHLSHAREAKFPEVRRLYVRAARDHWHKYVKGLKQLRSAP